MNLPFALPDWMPWWVPILLLVPALLYGLAFLFMPFGVIGVKGRLEAIEARLDEVQGEIRSLALRLPEPLRHAGYDDDTYAPVPVAEPPPRRPDPLYARPPIPPAAYDFHDDEPRDPAPDLPARGMRRNEPPPRAAAARAPRSEPRLDWPR